MNRRLVVVLLSVLVAVAVGSSTRASAEGADYEQVVDNSDKGRFAASGSWKKSDSGEAINGGDYRFALPSGKAANAMFKVKIPADGEYAVYARWPEVPGLNGAARVGVETAYGTQWTEVDQSRDGGSWVRVGRFELREGDEYSVKVSRDTEGEGNVVADAVKVSTISSYEDEPPSQPPAEETAPLEETSSPEEPAAGASAEQRTASAAGAGSAVVTKAKKFLGIKYKYATCTSTLMSCTCLTKKSFAPFGYDLPMTEEGQARAGRPISKAELRPGDLVYFREGGGSDITHIGIYSKPGYIVHASSYFGKVVQSQMKYINGYAGARRLV